MTTIDMNLEEDYKHDRIQFIPPVI